MPNIEITALSLSNFSPNSWILFLDSVLNLNSKFRAQHVKHVCVYMGWIYVLARTLPSVRESFSELTYRQNGCSGLCIYFSPFLPPFLSLSQFYKKKIYLHCKRGFDLFFRSLILSLFLPRYIPHSFSFVQIQNEKRIVLVQYMTEE